MSKRGHTFPALSRQTVAKQAEAKLKREWQTVLFPYPGQGIAVVMNFPMPNRWWRLWQWVLLGWRWDRKEAGEK